MRFDTLQLAPASVYSHINAQFGVWKEKEEKTQSPVISLYNLLYLTTSFLLCF